MLTLKNFGGDSFDGKVGADCPKAGTEIRIETRKLQESDKMEFQSKFKFLSFVCTFTSIFAIYFSSMEAKKMDEEIERRS